METELYDQEGIVPKSMGSYQLFAWHDAMSLALWLVSEYDLQVVRRAFDTMTQAQRADSVNRDARLIEEVIRGPETQLPALVRRACKDVDDVPVHLGDRRFARRALLRFIERPHNRPVLFAGSDHKNPSQERGVLDTYLCYKCISDSFLSRLVAAEGDQKTCRVCGEVREAITIERLGQILEPVMRENFGPGEEFPVLDDNDRIH